MGYYNCQLFKVNVNVKVKVALFAMLITLTACGSHKNVPYMANYQEYTPSPEVKLPESVIMPMDMLEIFVIPTDKSILPKFTPITQQQMKNDGTDRVTEQYRLQNFLVANDGNIEMNLVGKIHAAGQTTEELQEHITELVRPYFASDTDYNVTVRMCDYYVSVFGEVNNPGIFNTPRQRMTIFEALAAAGDMTIYGKRNDVKLIRTRADGEKEIHKLDFTDANILNSPYYYLQQRDIVYVEPNEMKKQEGTVGITTTLWFNGVSITVSLGSLLYNMLSN